MSAVNFRSPADIAVSGLRAQSVRLNVIAGNVANAFTSKTADGGPYRRRNVLLSPSTEVPGAVEVLEIAPDMKTAFKRVLEPGHPEADADGYVAMPNVELPMEMMHMAAASRAYQANAAVLKRYQEMIDITLELLR